MNIVSNKSAKAFNSASADALSHPLAFVEQVQLERILKLRKDDGEAFLVYRDTVRKGEQAKNFGKRLTMRFVLSSTR